LRIFRIFQERFGNGIMTGMNTSTKTIIFLVVAFIIIIGITVATRPAAAPTSTSVVSTSTPSVSSPPATATYTLAEVAKHATAADCWTAVGGNVYNLTSFVSKHPGGVENITKICGKDGTAAFTAQHGTSENAQKVLATLKIGSLAK